MTVLVCFLNFLKQKERKRNEEPNKHKVNESSVEQKDIQKKAYNELQELTPLRLSSLTSIQ